MDVRVDYKESWVPENWCFWTVVLEKTLESPLDCKEIQPVHPKGVQSWILIGRTDVVAETPLLWPPDAKNWFIGKDPDAGKDWRWEEEGTTEDEMVGWHHWLNGHEFEWSPGVGDGQGGLACCSPWGHKESDTTELLNWTELNCFPTVPYKYSFLVLLRFFTWRYIFLLNIFILHWLTMLWWSQVNSEGTQPSLYMSLISLKPCPVQTATWHGPETAFY